MNGILSSQTELKCLSISNTKEGIKNKQLKIKSLQEMLNKKKLIKASIKQYLMTGKYIKQKAILALLLLNLLIIPNRVAYAAENQISVELEIKQTLANENSATEQFHKTGTYELTGLTEESPMPEGSEYNVYAFSINGVDETVKIPMVYTHGGYVSISVNTDNKKAG